MGSDGVHTCPPCLQVPNIPSRVHGKAAGQRKQQNVELPPATYAFSVGPSDRILPEVEWCDSQPALPLVQSPAAQDLSSSGLRFRLCQEDGRQPDVQLYTGVSAQLQLRGRSSSQHEQQQPLELSCVPPAAGAMDGASAWARLLLPLQVQRLRPGSYDLSIAYKEQRSALAELLPRSGELQLVSKVHVLTITAGPPAALRFVQQDVELLVADNAAGCAVRGSGHPGALTLELVDAEGCPTLAPAVARAHCSIELIGVPHARTHSTVQAKLPQLQPDGSQALAFTTDSAAGSGGGEQTVSLGRLRIVQGSGQGLSLPEGAELLLHVAVELGASGAAGRLSTSKRLVFTDRHSLDQNVARLQARWVAAVNSGGVCM